MYRLGKPLAHAKDPRTFQLRKLLPATLPTPPAESYIGKGEPIRMYGNDDYGCCTCASHGHRIDLAERSSRQTEIQVSTDDVLAVYRQVEIGDDQGAYMLDVLNLMRQKGMGREADGTAHTITAFASIKLKDRQLWKVASWLFGGVYLGAWLPKTAEDQIDSGRWTVAAGPDAEPGSWGGHAMHSSGFSAGSVVLTTWDFRIRADWDWIDKYVDEAYVVISEDMLNGRRLTANGFSETQLQKYLASVRG